MSHYKLYSKYKDSGVEWLGEVPEHWKVKRLKHIADVRLSNIDKHMVEGQKVVRLCNYLDVYNNRNINSKIDFMSATASDEQIERLSLQKDDVIITKDSEDPSDIGIPALVEEDIFGLVCGYHLAILRPTASNGEYLHYLLQSTFVRSAFEIEATGMTRYALGKYSIENLIFALPHQSEQLSISSFLKQETSHIDTLISEKERLISLLQEYRQALISHAVTKGLDPKAKMKDSGVEWIGDIPEGWDLRRLKDVGTLFGGAGFPHEYQNVQGEELYFYKVGDLSLSENGKTLLDSPHTISREAAKTLRAAVIPKDAIVYAKIGAALILNRRRMTTADCCIDNNMTAYVTNQQRVLPDWAFSWLSAIDFGEHANPGAVPSLSEGYQSSFPIPVPPITEQTAIASFLDQETSRIDTLISETRKFIDLLKEYRSSLITAAVTGKIDVREVVPSGSEKREIAHE